MATSLSRSIRRVVFTGILVAAAGTFSIPKSSAQMPRFNSLFYRTHLLPGPYTLPAGRLVFGTSVAYGVTDFFQIGTNLIRDFYQFYNANAKVALVDFPEVAVAATLGYESYELEGKGTNPDVSVTSWQPGGVIAIALAPVLAWYVGGHLDFSSVTVEKDDVSTEGLIQGARVGSDLSWAYSPGRKSQVGNVLSAGVSYDLTYELVGFGASHHWPGFKLGVHYYPNADENKLLPIIVGGGSVQL